MHQRAISRMMTAAVLAVSIAGIAGCKHGSGPTSNISAATAFKRLAQQQKHAAYKITYETKVASATGAPAASHKMVYSVDGDKVALHTDGSDMYQTAKNKAVACTGSGSSTRCSPTGVVPGEILGLQAAMKAGITSVKQQSDRTFAGHTAHCWSFKYTLQGAPVRAEACLGTHSGVPLMMKIDFGPGKTSGSLESRATAVGTPEVSDFTPPTSAENT